VLAKAAQLDTMIMCQYLFAEFSLKNGYAASIAAGMETTMLTQVAGARAVEEATTVAGARDGLQAAAPLQLSHRILPAGEAVVDIGGELDIATAEAAVRYVRQVIDRHCGPVTVDLSLLRFCDASGLSGLLRMAADARQAGCPFRLASPSPSLVKIIRITGLDHRFLPPGQPPPDS
jgi:anti-anti-sigma factor